MSTLTHTHVRRQPMQHRVTVMETPEDRQYYGLAYDNYPDQDGNVKLPTGDYTSMTVPLMGLYLVEELESGRPNGRFDLLTFEQFRELYVEFGDPNLIYGFRSVGGQDVKVTTGTLESARDCVKVLDSRYPLGKFEVVSMFSGEDPDGDEDFEWTAVGR